MKLKLAISNIAWSLDIDEYVYDIIKKYGFTGLEIAPTRIFPETPYEQLEQASAWAKELKNKYGFVVPSMQSIWFGRQEKIFGTEEERQILLDYTKKAIDFAATIGCKNLVFGCPRNRSIPDGEDASIAISFFKELGDYAYEKGTVIGMEANPPIYNTNYINDTKSALELVETVDSKGFKLNLDVGTMIYNEESIDLLKNRVHLINHVHISEPGLKPIEERNLHVELFERLKQENYQNFVSIEMGKQEDVSIVKNKMMYIKNVFGE